jgi:hypothetical protein
LKKGNDCRGAALLRLLLAVLREMAFYPGKHLQKKSRVAKFARLFTTNKKVRGITNAIFLPRKGFPLLFSFYKNHIFYLCKITKDKPKN